MCYAHKVKGINICGHAYMWFKVIGEKGDMKVNKHIVSVHGLLLLKCSHYRRYYRIHGIGNTFT